MTGPLLPAAGPGVKLVQFGGTVTTTTTDTDWFVLLERLGRQYDQDIQELALDVLLNG